MHLVPIAQRSRAATGEVRPVETPLRPATPDDEPAVALLPGAASARACPFCGTPPGWEAHPSFPEAVRIACADAGCGVQPATEYLLHEFRAELLERWNTRPPPPAVRLA